MRRRRSGLGVALCAAVAIGTQGAQASGASPYTLSSIRAYLFYNDSGTFSPSIPENAPLWNTVIGEGWAGKSSNATLLRIVITGNAGSYAPGRSVQLIVRKGSRTTSGAFVWGGVSSNRRQSLAVLSNRGKTTLGFWVENTGCLPIRATAILRGQAPAVQLSRVVPFACGE